MGTTSTGNTVLEQHLAAEAVHDPEAAAGTYHEDSWYENAALGLRFAGREGVAFQYATSWGFIPDMAARYDWELDLGDTIVQCGRITGTAGAELVGVPVKGGPVDFAFTAVISFRDGLMEGEHIYYDLDDFCAQIGASVDAVRSGGPRLAALDRRSRVATLVRGRRVACRPRPSGRPPPVAASSTPRARCSRLMGGRRRRSTKSCAPPR